MFSEYDTRSLGVISWRDLGTGKIYLRTKNQPVCLDLCLLILRTA